MTEYSSNEVKMFKELGFEYLFDKNNQIVSSSLTPPVLYRMAVDKVFAENKQGPAVEALRKGWKAFVNSVIYRMTPEFDKLLEF